MSASDTLHRIGLGIGTIVLGAGVVLLFAPGVADSLPIGFLFVGVAALLAVLLGAWTVRKRYNTGWNETYVPAVEGRLSTPMPGDEIDDLIYRLTERREGTLEYRERIQERVAETAISAIRNRWSCSREQALTRLEEGTWTENANAARFFGAAVSTNSSFFDRLRERYFGDENAYVEQLRETLDAIEDVAGVEFSEAAEDDDADSIPVMDPGAILDESEGERVTDTVRYRALLPTNHWGGVTAFGLVALAAGLLTAQPQLLLASALGVGLAGYARASPAPALGNLEVTRTVSDDTPEPGAEIDVSVTVENTGSSTLFDISLIDRVPVMAEVVDGSARLGTALRPGGTATFSYTLVIERGAHSWPVQVVARNHAGSLEREAYVEPESDTTVNCVPHLKTVSDMPVRLQTSVYSGEVNTRIGGEGLEFFSLRDYQPGDSKRRIDWKTYAKTGEFTTIDFREENAARVVLLFDGRSSSYVSPSPGEKHAVDRSVDIATEIFASLNDQGHLVGVAAYNGIPCWLGPNTGTLHLEEVRRLFVDHPAISSLPPDLREKEEGRYVDPIVHVRRHLPANTQIFLFSPLTDEFTYEVARRLNGAGHLVTVISPDPTSGQSVGHRLARLERTMLIQQLMDHGIRVVDWDPERQLDIELEHARRRWGA